MDLASPSGGMNERIAARVGFVESVGFAAADTASNLYWQTVSVFLVYFYNHVFGLSAAAAAVMILITRCWDTFMDPSMGTIADRTRSEGAVNVSGFRSRWASSA
jgi:GPH family glycoside/pentoside/hexuronide:cation symporter